MVGSQMRLEAIGGPGERQTQHAGVVYQNINCFHRVGEGTHTAQVGQIDMAHLDVTRHLGGRAFGLWDRSTGDQHAVTGGGQCRGGRLTDAAVAAGNDDPHLMKPTSRAALDYPTSSARRRECLTTRWCGPTSFARGAPMLSNLVLKRVAPHTTSRAVGDSPESRRPNPRPQPTSPASRRGCRAGSPPTATAWKTVRA